MVSDPNYGKEIGAGGGGTVHDGPDDTVYKISTNEIESQRAVLAEFFRLSALKEKGISVPDTLTGGRLADGRLFMHISKMPGESFSKAQHDLNAQDIQEIRIQLSEIFTVLKEEKILHGDTNGIDNYMISRDNDGTAKVHLIDFGEASKNASPEESDAEFEHIDNILASIQETKQAAEDNTLCP